MDGSLVLALAAITVASGYAVAAWIWPYTNCLKCHGDGKLRSPSGRMWRRCKRCGGTGRRLRLGRRVLNALSDSAERASR
jgi:hypothetical protein